MPGVSPNFATNIVRYRGRLCLFLLGLTVTSKRLVKVTLKFFNECLDLSSHTLVADVNCNSIIRNVHRRVFLTR